jgi:acyl dehydratase
MADLSYESIEMNREFGPYKYPLKERIGRHLEAVENEHPWHRERSPWGPPVAPPAILGNMGMRFLDVVGPVPPGTLHARQEIETVSALRLDRQPIGYGVFTEKYEKRGRRWFTFETRWRDETGLILGVSRLRMVFPEEQGARSKEQGAEEGGRGKEERGGGDDGGRKMEDDAPVERRGTLGPVVRALTQERLTAYSEDSANALRGQSIHVQPEAAKRAGFQTTVAQGLMGADYMSELLENELGREWYDNSTFSVTFLRPVLCGATITASGRLAESAEEGAMVRRTYELWCENERGELVSSATAVVLVGRE